MMMMTDEFFQKSSFQMNNNKLRNKNFDNFYVRTLENLMSHIVYVCHCELSVFFFSLVNCK